MRIINLQYFFSMRVCPLSYFDQNVIQFQYAGVLDLACEVGDHAKADVVGGVFVGQQADLLQRVEDRLRAPATITAPMMEKAIMSGLIIPKAAMESTPRNWPITTPSIMEPTDEENESRMKADSCM